MKTISDIKKIKLSLHGLVIFEESLQDDKVIAFCGLLDTLTAAEMNCENMYIAYHRFYKTLAGFNWVEYLIRKLLDMQNEYILLASSLKNYPGREFILENIARDLKIIQALAEIKPQEIIDLIKLKFTGDDQEEVFTGILQPDHWPVWCWKLPEQSAETAETTESSAAQWLAKTRTAFTEKFGLEKNWENNASLLVAYYRQVGFGIFGAYGAFKLEDNTAALVGIANPDPIRLSSLICQEREQSLILENTESFLDDYPANNIILYGNRGTGKSSLVKALLNEYVARGLRLAQLKKNQIAIFPDLVRDLAKIPLKFIIFIDDLSFNDLEEDYKNLKSLLEGGVESRPSNVLVYATSNRRHLVKESFADRKSDDVHAHDNMEEKLSLADRFGITVTFLSPDQETYLKIVEGLARQHDIRMERDELRQRALKWVMMHNGRSGRTARQFIDHLIGELAREK